MPVFEFLFKYPLNEFRSGSLAFGTPGGVIVLLLAAAAIGVPAILSYAGARGRSTSRDRWVLGALRAASLIVLVVCLFRPMLLLSAAVPQRNYVGVLLDDSRSMRIADRDSAPRSAWIEHAFGGPDSAVLRSLREKFVVRLFRFSSSSHRIERADSLTYDAPETHLGDAIDQARQELDAVPLSGLVVVSDGADNSRAPIGNELLSLRARSVPIFTVGLGAERFDRDIELRRVSTSHDVLQGGTLVADLLVRQRGYAGRRVPLEVEDAGHIVSRDSITLPADGDVAPVRVGVVMKDAGPRALTFRIPLQPGEQVAQNNEQQALVNVRGGREKILYLEGSPRYEMRFIRAAADADSNLQLVVLQRTAANKFLRLNIDSADDLAAGFPKTRAELYRYRAIIIGSVEASFFTRDQLAMLADFVNLRGGGLLLLGGRQAFSEGGYAGTPLADVMPVVTSGTAVPDSMTFFADLKVALTPAGASSAVTQIAGSAAASLARWKTLPAVTAVNRIRAVKPGAITLVTGATPVGGRAGEPGESPISNYSQPVLVYQHYGRGLSVAFPIQDSFTWQMDPNTPPTDQTFDTFWRQMLRWLVSDVPTQVQVATGSDAVLPRTPVTIRANVSDSLYIPRNDAAVVAHVTSDAGTRDVPLDWAIDRDGEYRGTFTPDAPGIYSVRIEAKAPSGAVARDTSYLRVADLNTEYVDAEMRAPLLRRIADETGGKFYTPSTVGSLTHDLTLSKHGVTVVNQKDLWDMPAVWLLLVSLLTAEWWYRKTRGLA